MTAHEQSQLQQIIEANSGKAHVFPDGIHGYFDSHGSIDLCERKVRPHLNDHLEMQVIGLQITIACKPVAIM